MEKVFEDFFSELQADMVSVCLEYVEKRAEKIYIYCSCEGGVVAGNFFYMLNGKVIKKHKLNDVITTGQKEYDVSPDRQNKVLDAICGDINSLKKLCEEYKKDMPTQIKLVYDVTTNNLDADYKYDLIYTKSATKTSSDIFEKWYETEKNKEE